MSYTIDKQIIPGLPRVDYRNGKPEGVVLHETGNYGGTAQGNRNYEANHFNEAFVHFFVDWNSIVQVADTNHGAYGAGPVANKRFIHIELVRTHDKKQFADSYDRYTWLVSQMLHQYGLKPQHLVTLWTHKDVTQHLGGTTHQDPDAYLATFGVTVDKLISDITSKFNEGSKPEPKPAPSATKPVTGSLYRVRKSAGDVKSQIGAFKDKSAATDLAKKNKGYEVYDESGNLVYGNTVQPQQKPVSKPVSKPVASKSIVPYPGHILKTGSKGHDVERVQRALGISVDGIYGAKTVAAVKAYQKRHGLSADGIVGPATWSTIF